MDHTSEKGRGAPEGAATVDLDWLRAEAGRQGLEYTDADLLAIGESLRGPKQGLAAQRLPNSMDIEPAYRFFSPPAS